MTQKTSSETFGRLLVPNLSARVSAEESASVLARLIASNAASSKVELVEATGLARSTVSTGLQALEAIGLVEMGASIPHPGRGRRAQKIHIAPTFGIIAALDIGTVSTTIALFDFGQRELARMTIDTGTRQPHEHTLRLIADAVLESAHSLDAGPVRAVGAAVQAPFDVTHGTPASPPFLPGWTDAPVQSLIGDFLECVATARNDADVRALGEARHLPTSQGPLLYVRISEGVGAGFTTADGQLFTGATGAVGELGHIRADVTTGEACICGGLDHLNVHASRSAMERHWAHKRPAASEEGFVDALHRRDPAALRIAADTSRTLGLVLVDALLLLNPAHIALGGSVIHAGDAIVAGVRSTVYEFGFPLATRDLTITRSILGPDAGLRGCLLLALEKYLAASQLLKLIRDVDA